VIVISLLALLLVGAGITTTIVIVGQNSTNDPIVGASTLTSLPPTTPPPTTPPGRLTLSAPDTLAGLKKSTQADLQKAANDVVEQVKNGVTGAKEAVAGFYNDPQSAGKTVMFVGVTGDIISPTNEIDSDFTAFNTTSPVKIGNVATVSAGPLGGAVKCGDGKGPDFTIVLCVWSDNETVGLAVFYNRPVADSADLFLRIRSGATKRV
jgi:hypothetical protein